MEKATKKRLLKELAACETLAKSLYLHIWEAYDIKNERQRNTRCDELRKESLDIFNQLLPTLREAGDLSSFDTSDAFRFASLAYELLFVKALIFDNFEDIAKTNPNKVIKSLVTASVETGHWPSGDENPDEEEANNIAPPRT